MPLTALNDQFTQALQAACNYFESPTDRTLDDLLTHRKFLDDVRGLSPHDKELLEIVVLSIESEDPDVLLEFAVSLKQRVNAKFGKKQIEQYAKQTNTTF